MSLELDAAKARFAQLSAVRATVGPDRWLIEVLQLIVQHLENQQPAATTKQPRPRFVPSERPDRPAGGHVT